MIDEEKTFHEKGYWLSDLSHGSGMHVWAICEGEDCQREGGRGRWVEFRQYRDLCHSCAISKSTSDKTKKLISDSHKGDKCYNWKGGISTGDYCKFFDEPLKNAVRNYFDNLCFECGETVEENKGRKMSVHHVNYQKNCGCDNTQFCVYVPLCMSCHMKTNYNRWFWYNRFMIELASRNPNYYAYHIPVVYYDEPSYNYGYVFDINRTKNI